MNNKSNQEKIKIQKNGFFTRFLKWLIKGINKAVKTGAMCMK